MIAKYFATEGVSETVLLSCITVAELQVLSSLLFDSDCHSLLTSTLLDLEDSFFVLRSSLYFFGNEISSKIIPMYRYQFNL